MQSFHWYVIHLHVQTGTERNSCASFHLSYHFFSRSMLWNGTVLFEAFPSERNPSAFHFSEQHGAKWSDAFPCERGLSYSLSLII